ncbi:MAG TPA: ATP-binding protein, partial [Gemmataceae bacterium]
VAHDFNNLLTVILANSALVLKGAPPAVAGPLRAIEQAATKAAELTAKLLGFARRSAIHLEPLALNDVVRETAELLRRTIDPRIDLDLRLAGDLWAVEADRSMVSQVLMNLCLNARDAMPEGGRLTVETSNLSLDETETGSNLDARPGEFTRLRVRDTGCGIPPEVRARIFEPFFTTKDVGKGTGMGLAMVYGIVRMHNGWIEVESDVGSGTEFDVYLPRSRRTPVAPPEPPPPPTGGRETVLLVDDEPMIRDLGVAILERFGYRVLLACDGREAIDIYRDRGREIDLVVLDLTMPNLSGRDASRELRRIDPGVRILFTSGYSADYLDDSSELPALGFVSKPYRPDELAAAVRAALDRAPASPDG